VDPRNWGAIDFAPDKMDLGAQKAVFASYKEVNKSLNKCYATMKERGTPPHMEQAKHSHKIHKGGHHQSDDSASGEKRKSIKENKHRTSSKLTPMSETVAK
jgi:hypothetical protein